jgi:hypothetical protein
METIIQDASKGSPILAYGSASVSPKQKLMRLAALIFLLIALPVLIITGIFFIGSAQFPSSVLLSIALSPSKINRSIQGALVAELPAPWRTALETDTSFPVILGLAKTEKGEVAPFAIVPRTVSIAGSESVRIVKSGLFKTIVPESVPIETRPYRSFVGVLHARNGADAGWMIASRLLQMISGTSSSTADTNEDVYGSISKNRGKIFLSTESVKSAYEPGSFFVVFGTDERKATVLPEALLSQGIAISEVRAPEKLILNGDGGMRIGWSGLSDEERAMLAVAQGHVTGTAYQLPDQEIVPAITPEPGYASSVTNELLISTAWKQSSGEADTWKSSCPGDIRLALHGEALRNLLILFRTSPSWREKIQSFVIASDQNKTIFCINE